VRAKVRSRENEEEEEGRKKRVREEKVGEKKYSAFACTGKCAQLCTRCAREKNLGLVAWHGKAKKRDRERKREREKERDWSSGQSNWIFSAVNAWHLRETSRF